MKTDNDVAAALKTHQLTLETIICFDSIGNITNIIVNSWFLPASHLLNSPSFKNDFKTGST